MIPLDGQALLRKLAVVLAALAVPACARSGSAPGLTGLRLSTESLSFTASEGGADPADQTFLLTNTRTGSVMSWTVTPSVPWMTVVPSSGVLAAGASVLLTVHVDADYQLEAWEGATSLDSAPVARSVHSAALVNGQMVVWAGSDQSAPDVQLSSGGLYDPATNTWLGATSTTSMPTERHLHTAVSTGSEMLVWGGWKFMTGYFNDGGRYTPDSWTGALSTVGGPSNREAHSAVWTGTRMIVWGGWDGLHLRSGGLYDPVSDQWTGSTSLTGAPDGRQEHVAVWTGSRMVLWGGRNDLAVGNYLDTGALYDAVGDAWTGTTAPPGATLTPRSAATAVWTGREMVVWGGRNGSGPLGNGARYSPATDSWMGPLSTTGAPQARYYHSAVWTGSRMIVWGGNTASGVSTQTGGIWRPPVPAMGLHLETITVSVPGFAPVSLAVNLIVTP